jgi:hypothetical protein
MQNVENQQNFQHKQDFVGKSLSLLGQAEVSAMPLSATSQNVGQQSSQHLQGQEIRLMSFATR